MVTIYGIKNCDTMKKALRWLDEHSVDYRFHDYRKDGLDTAALKAWEKSSAGRPCSTAAVSCGASCRRRNAILSTATAQCS